MDQQNYIQWIRSKVGHEKIILTFAGGCIFNERGEVLMQRRGNSNKWGFPGGACIFREICASVPEERSAIPLETEQSSVC